MDDFLFEDCFTEENTLSADLKDAHLTLVSVGYASKTNSKTLKETHVKVPCIYCDEKDINNREVGYLEVYFVTRTGRVFIGGICNDHAFVPDLVNKIIGIYIQRLALRIIKLGELDLKKVNVHRKP